MNPHTTTPTRPSSLQWKVGKAHSYRPLILASLMVITFLVLVSVTLVQRYATRRAVHACDTGHVACRTSMGFTQDTVNSSEDAAEDQTVCGDGWRECIDAASEGNIQ